MAVPRRDEGGASSSNGSNFAVGRSWGPSAYTFLAEPWFAWVIGVGATAVLVVVLLLVCWCARHSLSSFFSTLGGPFAGDVGAQTSQAPEQGGGTAGDPVSVVVPPDKTHSASLAPGIVVNKDGSSPTESGGRPVSVTIPGPPPGLVAPISVKATVVQPRTPPSSAQTEPPGSPPMAAHLTSHKPQLCCSPASSPSPFSKDSALLPSGRRFGRARFGAGGLLESRRGSRTSLTLSLSPSVDSAIGKYPSPTKDTRQEMEYLRVASRPMRLHQLAALLQNNATALFKEFWEIPMNHASKREVPLPGIASKNRYQTIIPNENSRVVLPTINNDPLSTYINANYVQAYVGNERAFIATQGPMAHTVVDFWRMVWNSNPIAIVMITNLVEKNKTKCERYIPLDRESQSYGPVHVSVEDVEYRDGYTIRRLLLRCNEDERRCSHYWYTSWPDHTTPSTAKQLLHLVQEVRRLRRKTLTEAAAAIASDDPAPTRPVVVHCSAGLGRTGCFVALCNACDQLRKERRVDILGIVCRMRLNRGGLVQTNEQYEFIHQALATLVQDPSLLSDEAPGAEGDETGPVAEITEEEEMEDDVPPPPRILPPLAAAGPQPPCGDGSSSASPHRRPSREVARDNLSDCSDLRSAAEDLTSVRESPT